MAIRRANRDGASNEVRALAALRDRLLSAMPGSHARRAEADAEAVLEAYGFASRPGPKVRVAPNVLGVLAEALKGPHVLSVTYAVAVIRRGSGGWNRTAFFWARVATLWPAKRGATGGCSITVWIA